MYGFLVALWVLTVLDLASIGFKHGESRSDNRNNVGIEFFSSMVMAALLFGAGFWTQPMLWPKIVVGVLMTASLITVGINHGQRKKGTHNFFWSLIASLVETALYSIPLMMHYGWI